MSSIARIWRDFWFRPAPYLDLAVVRVLAVGVQLYVVLFRWHAKVVYSTTLPDELFRALPALRILMFGSAERPGASLVMAVYWITVVTGVTALAGWRTHLSLLLFAFGSMFTQAYMFGFGDFHHTSAVMMIALLALALSPSNRRLSLDSLLGRRYSRLIDDSAPDATRSIYAAWPLTMIQAFFGMMYLSAVISKLVHGGLDWPNGFTLQYYMIQDAIRWDGALAMWLSQFHTLLLVGQFGVLAFQGTFWLCVFFPRLRWFYVPGGIALHVIIYLTLQAPFRQWLALYSVFIPWSVVWSWLQPRITGRAQRQQHAG